jgi:hypothetical protein
MIETWRMRACATKYILHRRHDEKAAWSGGLDTSIAGRCDTGLESSERRLLLLLLDAGLVGARLGAALVLSGSLFGMADGRRGLLLPVGHDACLMENAQKRYFRYQYEMGRVGAIIVVRGHATFISFRANSC